MAEKLTIDEMQETAENLADRWVRGFLTDTVEELGKMDATKAAFVSGAMVALMHRGECDEVGEEERRHRVDRFLNLIAERYYGEKGKL